MTMPDLLNITPIGGVGQIGSNMTLFESHHEKIIFDTGILFPYEDFFGINYLIPDMENLNNISALIITHGHEDHIGAITHFVEKFPKVPIYAPGFASSLIQKKLSEHKLNRKINIYNDHSTLAFGDIKIDPIHVNHSIPDTFGLHLSVQNKISLFFASDFKIDKITPYEKHFDFEKLKKVSKGFGKKILMADSTNIFSAQEKTPSEIEIKPSLQQIIKKSSGHIFLTTFSSNLHRIQTIIDIAENENIHVVTLGRSMKRYIQSGIETGHFHHSKNINFDAIEDLPKSKKIIFILSGCQADFKSAFRRVISCDDKKIIPREGDTLILSSKSIPGNEKKIGLLVNKAIELGMDVFTNQNANIHVSGHPGKKDLLELYSAYEPDLAIPIHGESLFLKEHVKFIQKNCQKTKDYLLFNHWTFSVDETLSIKVVKNKFKDPLIIHGKGIPLPKKTISERRKIATLGHLLISIDQKNSFEMTMMGIPDVNDSLYDELELQCLSSIKFLTSKFKKASKKDLSEQLRIKMRNFLYEKLGYKPIITVHHLGSAQK